MLYVHRYPSHFVCPAAPHQHVYALPPPVKLESNKFVCQSASCFFCMPACNPSAPCAHAHPNKPVCTSAPHHLRMPTALQTVTANAPPDYKTCQTLNAQAREQAHDQVELQVQVPDL